MLAIRHRINTLVDLKTVPRNMGIELDLRYEGKKLILHHDPFVTGLPFEKLLKAYRHAFLVANVKTEGIEEEVRYFLRKYRVKDYFFLDLSFPALIRMSRRGERNIAARFSEYEPLEQCLALKGRVKWVWIDCFRKLPLNRKNHAVLSRHFKTCLVSPELQKHPVKRIASFRKTIASLPVDAVCTKVPELWRL